MACRWFQARSASRQKYGVAVMASVWWGVVESFLTAIATVTVAEAR